ncbi:MAG: flagellar basal body P-ring protein FlgI [Aestuariivirgaceae bacterium]
MTRWIVAILLITAAFTEVANATVRIKDIASVQGVRENQLIGYGLVIGLQGTGDSLRNSPFTAESLRSMLERLGINFATGDPRTQNIAAVMVTATLPAFIGRGSRIDVSVSSLGDASSLAGGTLIQSPLHGADGKIYAVGQGPLAVSGFAKQGEAESISQGVPTTGRIPNGAIIEREITGNFRDQPTIVLEVRNPDFNTVVDIADAINAYTSRRYKRALAQELDARTISVARPDKVAITRFIAEIGRLAVIPDTPARVVIDERTGTIVIGHKVQINTVAVTHGNLTVRITELPQVSQPAPFSEGETAVVPRTLVETGQKDARLAILNGGNLQSLVEGLNAIGLKPTGIIAILQAIKTAGALQAELVVQ